MMKKRTTRKWNMVIIVILLLLCLLIFGGYRFLHQSSYNNKSLLQDRASGQTTVFRNVNVIPMDQEKVVEKQDVLIQDGKITRIGNTGEIEIPEQAQIIDGTGKFLIPGLIDMHTHVSDKDDLLLLTANGVTTIRNVWGYEGLQVALGFPNHLELKREVEAGLLLGPRIITSGPILEGEPANSPMMSVLKGGEQAEAEVRRQKQLNYDYIKVYDNLDMDTYKAIVQEAGKLDIKVIGHVPYKVGIDAAIENKQYSIEHTTGYIDPDMAEFLIPKDRVKEYANKTKQAGIWNCPTFVVWQHIVPYKEFDKCKDNNPLMKYISPKVELYWRMSAKAMNDNIKYQGTDYNGKMLAVQKEMVQALHEAGAGLVAGTDMGNPFVFAGESLHEELSYFVEAGLSPYEALRTATTNAAECLMLKNEIGIVREGRKADLVLLNKSPLEDIRNTKTIEGVIANGSWLSREALDGYLAGIAKQKGNK